MNARRPVLGSVRARSSRSGSTRLAPVPIHPHTAVGGPLTALNEVLDLGLPLGVPHGLDRPVHVHNRFLSGLRKICASTFTIRDVRDGRPLRRGERATFRIEAGQLGGLLGTLSANIEKPPGALIKSPRIGGRLPRRVEALLTGGVESSASRQDDQARPPRRRSFATRRRVAKKVQSWMVTIIE